MQSLTPFNVIGSRLGISERQAKRDFRSAMGKIRRNAGALESFRNYSAHRAPVVETNEDLD